MRSLCTNCKANLEADHSFCPNCGFDLRQTQSSINISSPTQEIKPSKPSKLDRLGSPGGSILISLVIGAIVMDIINGNYKSNNHIVGIIGSILGGGVGFLIAVLIPSLVISLIGYAIKKRFPKAEFSALVYIFTILMAWLFLATLYNN